MRGLKTKRKITENIQLLELSDKNLRTTDYYTQNRKTDGGFQQKT